MLNKIWPFFIIISFIFALLTGNINNFNNSIFDSCTQAVDLIIKLFGTMCLWNGVMKIVQKSSLINKLSNMISPLMKFLFPKMNKGDKEYKEVSTYYMYRRIKNVPGALVEVGFLTNPNERYLLRQNSYQNKICYHCY